LERPRLPSRRALIAIALGAALLVTAVALWPRSDTVEGYAYPIPTSAEGNRIEILNGTDQRALARNGTRVLRAAGFDVVSFGNAPEPRDSTLILVRPSQPGLGDRLRRALGTGDVRPMEDSTAYVDATVILGRDYRLPEGLYP